MMEFIYEMEFHGQRMNAEQARERLYLEQLRPCLLHKPTILLDGNAWCVLLGPNIQEGICGFGDSPYEAPRAFDKAWFETVTP